MSKKKQRTHEAYESNAPSGGGSEDGAKKELELLFRGLFVEQLEKKLDETTKNLCRAVDDFKNQLDTARSQERESLVAQVNQKLDDWESRVDGVLTESQNVLRDAMDDLKGQRESSHLQNSERIAAQINERLEHWGSHIGRDLSELRRNLGAVEIVQGHLSALETQMLKLEKRHTMRFVWVILMLFMVLALLC